MLSCTLFLCQICLQVQTTPWRRQLTRNGRSQMRLLSPAGVISLGRSRLSGQRHSRGALQTHRRSRACRLDPSNLPELMLCPLLPPLSCSVFIGDGHLLPHTAPCTILIRSYITASVLRLYTHPYILCVCRQAFSGQQPSDKSVFEEIVKLHNYKLQGSSWAVPPESQAVSPAPQSAHLAAQASWTTPQVPDAPTWDPRSDCAQTRPTSNASGAQHGSWDTQEQPWQRQQQQQRHQVDGWGPLADAKVEGNLAPAVEAEVTGKWGQTAEAKVKGASKATVAPGDWGQAAGAVEGDGAGAEPTQGGKAEVGEMTTVFYRPLACRQHQYKSVAPCNW